MSSGTGVKAATSHLVASDWTVQMRCAARQSAGDAAACMHPEPANVLANRFYDCFRFQVGAARRGNPLPVAAPALAHEGSARTITLAVDASLSVEQGNAICM
jgi:hypothetical protein